MATLNTWANASNTGVPAGVTLKALTAANMPAGVAIDAWGNINITQAGVVLSGFILNGCVNVEANNVTVQNCSITSAGSYDVYVHPGVTGATVENCEINGTGVNNDGSSAISGQGTFIGNNIYNVENGINVAGSSTIEYNYIHDLLASGSPHYDGVQIDGAVSNITISNNTIINPNTQTSAIMIDNGYGAISNISVDDNILSGGGFTVYSDGHFNSSQITGVSFTNNHMGSGYYGYTDFTDSTPTYTGNVDDAATLIASLNSQAPAAPAISSWSPDTGVVGDGITKATKLTLAGTGSASSTVKVYDGATLLGSVAANASGAWSYATATLGDGIHKFTVTDTVSGVASAASSAVSVTVDTTPPAAPAETSDSVVNGNQVTVNGTAAANSTITIYDGGSTVVGTGVTNASGKWSVTTSALPVGLNALAATATDAAGNVGASSGPLDPLIGAVTVAYFLANRAGIDAISNAFTVADSAANVTANLAALAGDSHLGAITLTNSGTPTLTLSVAAAHAGAAAVAKITTPHTVAIADTAQHLAALTTTAIGGFTSLGVKQLQATDADVSFSRTQTAALGAAGISLRQPYSGGTVDIVTWNAAGTVHDINYLGVQRQPYTSVDVVYGANGLQTSMTWSNAAGIYRAVTLSAGVWRELVQYQVTGQPWTSYDIHYGANGQRTSVTWSNGQSRTWTYNSDGSVNVLNTGVPGQPWTSNDLVYAPNGALSSESWSNAAGVYRTVTLTAGVWREMVQYQVTGQPWTSYDVLYDAKGRRTSVTWSNGQSQTWTYNADGSFSAVLTEPPGSNVLRYEQIFSSTKVLLGQASNNSTSTTLKLDLGGATVTQSAGALSVRVGADTFAFTSKTRLAITATGAASDTFNLSSGFGTTSIADFLAGGSGGDTVNFHLSMFNSSWFAGTTTINQEVQALLSHAKGTTNTQITDLAGDTLTLMGVSNSTLSAHLSAIRFT